jgi:hypothetical protein
MNSSMTPGPTSGKHFVLPRRFWLLALALFISDWGWGMAQVRGLVPLWSFLPFNFPFALPYVWLERHWAGTRYVVGGQTVDELWSLGFFLLMVLGQAWLYAHVLDRWHRRPRMV